MPKSIDELKQELSLLEGKEPPQPTPAASSDDPMEKLNALFAGRPKTNEKKGPSLEELRQRENALQRVCPLCYRRQPITTGACVICGEFPAIWVPSNEPEPAHACDYPRYSERQMFVKMANTSTLAQLQTASRSGWAHTPERERFISRTIAQRVAEEAPVTAKEPAPQLEQTQPQPKKAETLDELVAGAREYYRIVLEQFHAEHGDVLGAD